jgi:MFS family permease
MTQDNPVSYTALLRGNHNFRNLWFGQIISLLGDWFNLIASAALIAELTQSGTAIGSLFVVRMLAPFLVSPIAGVVADRYNRKAILLATDLLRAVVVLGFLLVRSAEHIWLLYLLTAVQLGISGFYFPTRNAILPDLVSRAELGAANAISAATWSTMLALGAALGGLVAGVWGNQPAFVIDALTFVVSAFFISRIVYQPTVDPESESSDKTVRGALRQYLDGLRYMRQQLDVLVIALHKPAIALLITTGFQVIQVRIAEQVFVIGRGGGISLGIMYGVVGIGTGLGPILARYFTGDRDKALRTAIIIGYLLSAVGLLIASPLTDFYILQLGILLRGIGAGTVWVFSTQLLLQLVPNHVRGRVFATEYAIFTLMSAISAAITGPAMDLIGISGLLVWMAILSLLPMVLWMLWMVRGQPQVVESEQWGH